MKRERYNRAVRQAGWRNNRKGETGTLVKWTCGDESSDVELEND